MHKQNRGIGGPSLLCRRIIAVVFLLAISFFVVKPDKVFAGNTDNFYFDDFTADYYLSKDDEGVSVLKVVESFTAIFPNYNQNKGICRGIPFTNQDGKNLTLDELAESDIIVKRNGASEPIYSIEKENGEYVVCTGTNEYIKGKQIFTFEYTFHRVITEFSNNGSIWQELYWDTNGTGSKQRTDHLTARLHVTDPLVLTGDAWCYVGAAGSNNQRRCIVTKTDDGFEFVTKDLKAYENLTFDVEIKKDSFVIPDPVESYRMVYVAVAMVIICCVIIGFSIKKYIKAKPHRDFYKGLFVKPEYEPKNEYDMHVLAEDYIGAHGNPSVATIIKLIVDGKVKLIKGDKKLLGGFKWSLEAVNVDSLGESETLVLKILNGGLSVKNGDTIKLKQRTATTSLVSLSEKLNKHGKKQGKACGLLVNDRKKNLSASSAMSKAAITVVIILAFQMIMIFIAMPALFILISDASDIVVKGNIDTLNEVYIEGVHIACLPSSLITMAITFFVTVLLNSYLKSNSKKYLIRTEEGLKVSRYLDGLKMYIKMAEADRIKFLQSVPGADVSAEGIVKLYEKLLPYAIFFNLEKTWMKEMQKFCTTYNVDPSAMHLNVSDIAMMNTFMRAIPSTTNFGSSSSYSSGSSGFSGGGGGGFSGGGGGGGSVGGR